MYEYFYRKYTTIHENKIICEINKINSRHNDHALYNLFNWLINKDKK